MTTFAYGSSARPADHLGFVASAHLEAYGDKPGSLYQVLRAPGLIEVEELSGNLSYADASQIGEGNPDDASWRRAINTPNHPPIPPVTETNVAIDLDDWGREFQFDLRDPKVQRMAKLKGEAAVEEWAATVALNYLLQGLSREWLATLGNGTTPFDAADINAAGDPWSANSADLIGMFADLKNGYGLPGLNSLVMTLKNWYYALENLSWQTRWATPGVGSGGEAGLLAAFAGEGFENVYIVQNDADLLDDAVVAFRKAPDGPAEANAGLVLAYQVDIAGTGFGSMGSLSDLVKFSVRDVDGSATVKGITASLVCDPNIVIPTLGGRIHNTY